LLYKILSTSIFQFGRVGNKINKRYKYVLSLFVHEVVELVFVVVVFLPRLVVHEVVELVVVVVVVVLLRLVSS